MKKILVFIITIVITILICLLCFSYNIKSMVVDSITNQYVREKVSKELTKSMVQHYDSINLIVVEEIKAKISNSDELNNITSKYVENIVDSIINNKENEAPDIKDNIYNLIDENKTLLESNNIIINDNMKEEIANYINNDQSVKDVYTNVLLISKDMIDEDQKQIVHILKDISKPSLRYLIYTIIAVLTLFIALLRKSCYSFLYNLGQAFLFSGIILVFLFPTVFKSLLNGQMIGVIEFDKITNFGCVCLIGAAVFTIIYLVINKILKKDGEEQNAQ